MKNLILFFLLFGTLNTFGQGKNYHPVKIDFTNGEQLDCFVSMPLDNEDFSSFFFIKRTADVKWERIKSDNVVSIIIQGKNESAEFRRKESIWKRKMSKKFETKWYQVEMECEDFTLYSTIERIDIDKHGEFKRYNNGPAPFWIESEKDEKPQRLGYLLRSITGEVKRWDESRLKDMKYYFQDDQDVLNFLKGKETLTQLEMFQYLESMCVEI